MEEYQAADVNRICGVKRNRLQTWLENGWIVPSIQKATGHGTRNIFSKMDLYKIALFRQAVESGISRTAAGEFIPVMDKILNSIDHLSLSVEGWPSEPIVTERRTPAIAFLRLDGKVIYSQIVTMGMRKTDFPVYEKEWDDIVVLNVGRVILSIESNL